MVSRICLRIVKMISSFCWATKKATKTLVSQIGEIELSAPNTPNPDVEPDAEVQFS